MRQLAARSADPTPLDGIQQRRFLSLQTGLLRKASSRSVVEFLDFTRSSQADVLFNVPASLSSWLARCSRFFSPARILAQLSAVGRAGRKQGPATCLGWAAPAPAAAHAAGQTGPAPSRHPARVRFLASRPQALGEKSRTCRGLTTATANPAAASRGSDPALKNRRLASITDGSREAGRCQGFQSML